MSKIFEERGVYEGIDSYYEYLDCSNRNLSMEEVISILEGLKDDKMLLQFNLR